MQWHGLLRVVEGYLHGHGMGLRKCQNPEEPVKLPKQLFGSVLAVFGALLSLGSLSVFAVVHVSHSMPWIRTNCCGTCAPRVSHIARGSHNIGPTRDILPIVPHPAARSRDCACGLGHGETAGVSQASQ